MLVAENALKLYKAGRSRAYVLKAIGCTPKGLKALYRHLLDSVDEEDLSQSWRLMQWVCFAMRPLRMQDLRSAMVVDPESPYTSLCQHLDNPEYVKTDEQMERYIRYLSKGLIEVKSHSGNRIAQFIHQSVSDYLLETGFQLFDNSSTDSVVGRDHYWLSRSCIEYLSMEEIKAHDLHFGEGRTRAMEKGRAMVQAFPFLGYSTIYWTAHAERVENEDINQDDLVTIFHPASESGLQQWITIYHSIEQNNMAEIPTLGSSILHIASAHNLLSVVAASLINGVDPNANN